MKSVPGLSSSWRFAILRLSIVRLSSASCVLLLTLTAALFPATLSFARPQDAARGARGLFLDTRPSDNKGTPSKTTGKPGKMGLGYTLFVEQGGTPRRVSPDHVFHSGDRVRILVETNREVYLYVFHQEGPGSADLLFPDARLHGGENIVSAHQSSYIPNTGWFTFDNHAGDEKLTLVASEKPLEGVPRRSELKGTETFQMSPDSLARLVASSLPAMQDAQADDGKPMTATEGARGLTLSMNDPPPSRLVINKTTQSGWITAQVVLTHR